jgi:hypothetical protein
MRWQGGDINGGTGLPTRRMYGASAGKGVAHPMPDDLSPSTRYRRLARECLEVAQTFPAGERRTVLLQMAQVWQRLADEYADSSAPLLRPLEGEQPIMQQQQQAQPKDDDKNMQQQQQAQPKDDDKKE